MKHGHPLSGCMGNGSEQITDVTVEGDAPCGDLLRDEGLAFVDADVLCLWVLKDLPPEVVFDDAGRIGTDPQLQIDDRMVAVTPHIILITPGGRMPAFVLDEGVVHSQADAHRCAAMRAGGDERGRDAHVALLLHHGTDGGFIVIGFLPAGTAALKQPVVALCVKQPLFVKAGLLKTVVHVGGQHEVVFLCDERQQLSVQWDTAVIIAVVTDVPAPPCPVFLQGVKRVKSAGIHVRDAVAFAKITKEAFKPLTVVCERGSRGEAAAGADEDGIGLGDLLFCLLQLTGAVRRADGLFP